MEMVIHDFNTVTGEGGKFYQLRSYLSRVGSWGRIISQIKELIHIARGHETRSAIPLPLSSPKSQADWVWYLDNCARRSPSSGLHLKNTVGSTLLATALPDIAETAERQSRHEPLDQS